MRCAWVVLIAGCRGFFNTPPATTDAPGVDASPDAAVQPIAYIQSTSQTFGVIQNASVTFPLSQQQGDLTLVVVQWNDANVAIASVDDTSLNTYLGASPVQAAPNDMVQQSFYAADIKPDIGVVVHVGFSASTGATIGLVEYAGATGVDVAIGQGGAPQSIPSSGAIATHHAHDLIVALFACDAPTQHAPTAGYTPRITSSQAFVGDTEVFHTDTFDVASTEAVGCNWVTQLVALTGH